MLFQAPGKYRLIQLIAFAFMLLSACVHTEGRLDIKGKVIDEGTKAGIPNKKVIVQGLVYTPDNVPDTIETGQFSTDSSGCFSYSLKKVRSAHYYNFSLVGDSDYIFMATTLGLYELNQNAKFLSFSLNKLVDLTINLYRKSRKPGCDTIRLIWESNGVYGGSLYPYKIRNYAREGKSFGLPEDMDLIWIGGKVNSTILTRVFADKKTELTWELYRNGRRRIFTDTITCRREFTNIVNFTY
jgi:hypothetical protein